MYMQVPGTAVQLCAACAICIYGDYQIYYAMQLYLWIYLYTRILLYVELVAHLLPDLVLDLVPTTAVVASYLLLEYYSQREGLYSQVLAIYSNTQSTARSDSVM